VPGLTAVGHTAVVSTRRSGTPRRLGLGVAALIGVVALTTSTAGAGAPSQASPTTTTTTKPASGAPTTTTTTAPKPQPKPGGTVAWQPAGRSVAGTPLLYLATLGAAGLAWMPPNLIRPAVVLGTGDAGGPHPWGSQVDPASRSLLIAAFNGGFQFKDFVGGVLSFGRTYRAFENGQGSFVVFADGAFNVGLWGRDFTSATPNIVAVRQNLPLLVDGGTPVPSTANPGAWGGSVAGVATARSALGVDANGGLVWASGRLSPADLAASIIAAGAVRAMQLDINPDWVNFNLYAPGSDGAIHGSAVYGATGPDRYFRPDSRDFIVVMIRGTIVPGDSGKTGQPPVPATLRLPTKK
jgi:phosphodiester glycosidase